MLSKLHGVDYLGIVPEQAMSESVPRGYPGEQSMNLSASSGMFALPSSSKGGLNLQSEYPFHASKIGIKGCDFFRMGKVLVANQLIDETRLGLRVRL